MMYLVKYGICPRFRFEQASCYRIHLSLPSRSRSNPSEWASNRFIRALFSFGIFGADARRTLPLPPLSLDSPSLPSSAPHTEMRDS